MAELVHFVLVEPKGITFINHTRVTQIEWSLRSPLVKRNETQCICLSSSFGFNENVAPLKSRKSHLNKRRTQYTSSFNYVKLQNSIRPTASRERVETCLVFHFECFSRGGDDIEYWAMKQTLNKANQRFSWTKTNKNLKNGARQPKASFALCALRSCALNGGIPCIKHDIAIRMRSFWVRNFGAA